MAVANINPTLSHRCMYCGGAERSLPISDPRGFEIED
jgi:hypothetical protein